MLSNWCRKWNMKINFGIREKTALLVILLVGATAYFTPRFLIKDATKIVEKHELVDLADEAELRGWRLFNEIENLKAKTEQLAEGTILETFAKEAHLEKAAHEEGDRLPAEKWAKYLRVEKLGGGAPELVFSRFDSELPEIWNSLLAGLGAYDEGEVGISRIERINIAGADTAPDWAPVICAGVRVRPDEYLMVMFNLRLTGTSRHLIFLADNANEFLDHPGREHQDFYDKRHKEVFLSAARDFDRRRDERRSRGELPLFQSVSREPDNITKKEDAIPIDPPYAIQEGAVGSKFIDYLKAHSDKRAKTLQAINAQLELRGAQAGELTSPVNLVRILARSENDLEDFRKIIERQLEIDYPELDKKDYRIDWERPVLCGACDININRITLETIEGPREYKLLFTGFRDELVSNLNREMGRLWGKIIFPSIFAGMLAFLVTLFFVRPLRAISKSAQHVTVSGEDSNQLQHKIEEVRRSLPVHKRDEVGHIARSLESLLRQVLKGHERLRQLNADLDGKVREQTKELLEANDELRGLAAAKDEFLASVSHELRQPLNSIFGYIQFLEMSDLDEEQKGDVEKTHLAATYLHRLINDILDYQKIIMGGLALEPADFEAAEFFQNVKDSMKPQAAERGNQFVFEGIEGLGVLHNDRARLQQILINLLSNACKFTGDGTISLNAQREIDPQQGDLITIQVSDTGRGMKPEEMDHLFVKFKKLASKEGNKTGTGLGLVISKGLCELMGGSISCESEFGKGSTFTVVIPACVPDSGEVLVELTDVPAVSATVDRVRTYVPDPGKHPLVLVIDDEVTVCKLMARFLEGHGYEVISAIDAESGLALAKERHPAVITLDVVLPGKDGWEVLSNLKADPDTADIPVIMVTFIEEKKRGYTLGADDYLVKPVDWEDFSRRIQRVLGTGNSVGPVLVVDDDSDTRTLFRRTLELDGLTVVEAKNGEEALARVAETPPSVIVLDLMMPVMDGFEFVEKFRQNPDWREIPVVVVTAKSTDAADRRRLDGHVRDILNKGGSEQGNLLGDILALVHRHAPGATLENGSEGGEADHNPT